MDLTAATPKSIQRFQLHRGKPFAGGAICVFPTSGKFSRGILSLGRDSAPRRPPQAHGALSKYFLVQTDSKQHVTKRSEANRVLGKPAGQRHMDSTSRGERRFIQAGCFFSAAVCAVGPCRQAAARCSPLPCSPALLPACSSLSCLPKPKPARLCRHPCCLGPGSPTSSL